MDTNITTISPVNKLHARDDVLPTGSSRSLFIWRPKEKFDVVERLDTRKIIVFGGDEKKRGKRSKDDYDDDDRFNFKGNNIKVTNRKAKRRVKNVIVLDLVFCLWMKSSYFCFGHENYIG